jgi:hypothetical protein
MARKQTPQRSETQIIRIDDLPNRLLKTVNRVLAWLQFPLPHDQHGFSPSKVRMPKGAYPYDPIRKPYTLSNGKLHILPPYKDDLLIIDRQLIDWIAADVYQAILAGYDLDLWALQTVHLWKAHGRAPRPQDEGEDLHAFLLRLKHWLLEQEGMAGDRREKSVADLLTFAVAVKEYEVSRSHLQRLVHAGELVSYRVAGRGPHRVSRTDVANRWRRRGIRS